MNAMKLGGWFDSNLSYGGLKRAKSRQRECGSSVEHGMVSCDRPNLSVPLEDGGGDGV